MTTWASHSTCLTGEKKKQYLKGQNCDISQVLSSDEVSSALVVSIYLQGDKQKLGWLHQSQASSF